MRMVILDLVHFIGLEVCAEYVSYVPWSLVKKKAEICPKVTFH